MKISGASAPERAMTAPTERSIPPVAITSVMPIATMAIVATWEMLTASVCVCRKLGVTMMLKTRISPSAISPP